MATMVLETPFDPQALFTALNYVSNVFSASSWQNLLKLFFMIALINGIISVGIYHKTDYIKQFLIALGFASVLSIPIGDNLAIKRSDTEKVYTINNSKAPFILVYTISTVNSVTKWFTKMAGASINSPNYTGMYDAGIGSNGNIIRNSMDMTFKDPKLKADMVQFIKECTLYDIRDGAVSMDALINNGNGFDLILNNTSPARFVSMNSTTGRPEVKTCQEASAVLKGKINTEAQLTLTGKAANFFYNKDVAPLMIYSTAVQSSYQTQLNINSNVSQIAKQNMFNHLLEVSGEDIARLVNDPTMAESAAIHMGTARAAKKAAFQQSIIAQLGKDLLPSMSSWFAIIIIMLFPFVVLIFVVTQFNNMFQILVGYMGTLFWICCWQPIFAIINGLANWELGRQLAKTGAFKQEGIPYGYVHTVYDTLLNNHAMVGWMVILTPIIAGMVVYGTYRGFSHLGNSIFSSYQGAGSAVGNEMSDGNLSMGNTTIGNNSLSNSSQNTTSANKFNTSIAMNSGWATINNDKGYENNIFGAKGMVITRKALNDEPSSIYSHTTGVTSNEIDNFTANTVQTLSARKEFQDGVSNIDGRAFSVTESKGTVDTVSSENGWRNTKVNGSESYTDTGQNTVVINQNEIGQTAAASQHASREKQQVDGTHKEDFNSNTHTGKAGVSAGLKVAGIGADAGYEFAHQRGGREATTSTSATSQSSGASVSVTGTVGNSTITSVTTGNNSGVRTYTGSNREQFNGQTTTNAQIDQRMTENKTEQAINRNIMLVSSGSSEMSGSVGVGKSQEINTNTGWTTNISLDHVGKLDHAIMEFRMKQPEEYDKAYQEAAKNLGIDPQKDYLQLESTDRLNMRDALNPIAMQKNQTYLGQTKPKNGLPGSISDVVQKHIKNNDDVDGHYRQALEDSNFQPPKK